MFEGFKNKSRREKQSIFWGWGLSLAIILVIVVILSNIQVINWVDYENKRYGVRIKYPAGWLTKEEAMEGSVVVFQSTKEHALDDFYENFNISYVDLSKQPMTLNEFARTGLRQMELTFEELIKVTESKIIQIGTRRAYRVVYVTIGEDHDNIRYQHVFIVDGNDGYVLTYVSHLKDYKKFMKFVNGMIKSFEIM